MNSENLEFALNHLAEAVKKINGQHDYTVKAIESLVEINRNLINSVQQSNTNQTISIDTRQLEHRLGLKIAEMQGILKNQPRETNYSKSYFLYPEGESQKALLYLVVKYLSIVLAAIFLFLTIKLVAIKIEDNSQNAQYRTAIQYIYATGKTQTRDYLEEILKDVRNDSIKVEYQKKIDRCPVKIK